jgi:Ca2+-binding EF-hand superfamily protein
MSEPDSPVSDAPADAAPAGSDAPVTGPEELIAGQIMPGGRRARLSRAFTTQQRVEIENAFRMFDTDGSGSIDHRELKVAMKALGMQAKADDITRIMGEVDIDNSGTIDKGEFMEIVRPILGGRDPHSEVRKCFEYFDLTDSGKITAKDLAQTMEELGEDVTPEELRAMMDVADRNGDGAVDVNEFIRLVARLNLGPEYLPSEQEELEQIKTAAEAARSEKAAPAAPPSD